jgi:hypothetical protein
MAEIDPKLTCRAWEFGRLVLDPGCRSSPELVRQCVFLGVQQLSLHTAAENVLACCTPMLARLYRRFGATVLSRTASSGVADDGAETYCLMHGTVRDMLRTSAPQPQAIRN